MRDEALRRLLEAGPELEWNDWAMRPAGLAAVVELAAGRDEIVECGAGLSTLVLARLARMSDSRVRSLEHDAAWTELVRSRLAAEGLERWAAVVHAPLAPHPLAPDGDWYASAALAELPAKVDLLLVDGPPAGEPEIERRRYPALPALLPRLPPDALVVLDDADRPGERWILERWERETPYRFTEGPGDIAIGRPRAPTGD